MEAGRTCAHCDRLLYPSDIVTVVRRPPSLWKFCSVECYEIRKEVLDTTPATNR